ncbi:alpha-L-rhamnosidase [Butyrivibrio sp. MB2005]|uniref:alpha-L-rhamnosidase n=1 Tax=Butyrivibrio sp. MB2005 TaxID=1280678 RepID=UPI0003FC1AB1|nr:alpha-L-rhamnosidase [Butyrivibrio sp. MB2005]
MGLKIVECKTEYRSNPLGIDTSSPRFSWKLESDENDTLQKSAKVIVKNENGEIVWDSGEIEDGNLSEVCYEGDSLKAKTCYSFDVTVTDNHGRSSESKGNFFETGFMMDHEDTFEGAKWIGPTKCSLSSDVYGIFGLTARFRIHEGSSVFAVVLGRNDKRIKDRENYFKFELDVKEIPALLRIYRVGILPEDTADKPIVEVPVKDCDDPEKKDVLTEANRYKEHELFLDVRGNGAYTVLDGKRIDVSKDRSFFGEIEAPRALNPIGTNDVNTFPRLNEIGVFVPKGQGADLYSLEVKNLRKPYSVVYSDTNTYVFDENRSDRDEDSHIYGTASDDLMLTKDPSHTSIPMLRKEFDVTDKKIKKARLYATARGIYECRINGSKVTDTWFNPGATQYDRHLYYQTYDITEQIKEGKNAIGVILASGWWSDAQTFVLGNYNYYGDKESFLGLIEVTYEDGSVVSIPTETDTWKYYGEGPYTYAGFFHGEHYDATRDEKVKGFSEAGFADGDWEKPAEIEPTPIYHEETMSSGPVVWPEVNIDKTSLIGQVGDGVKVSYELTALSVSEVSEGVYIYDMGVNVAGVPKLRLYGEKGATATLRYAELLYPDIPEFTGKAGTMMVENLRDADCTDLYTFKGDDNGEEYTPAFTFRGYRYIEISGVSKKPELSDVKMLVLSSAFDMTSSLETSDELTNKFIQNVRRSQQSNFISIPTDCPQRNERMGWDGDTSIFARTAMFHADTRLFYENWLMCMRDLQDKNGKFPDIAPVGGGFGGYTYESSAIHVTWELFQQYGDVKVIRDNYDALKLYMDYSAGLWEQGDLGGGFTLGDWLAPDETDIFLICHAFYGYNAYTMARMAKVIEKDADAKAYQALYEQLKVSFNEKYFDKETGKTKDDTQCSYALPLSFKMVTDEMKKLVGDRLSDATKKTGYLVKTGFFGTAPLNPMLTETGHSDDAYKLMSQKGCPSWLYPVTQGATSIWERWDSFTIENGFGGHNSMNSFNHYSLGAVIEWFYMYALGIMRDEDAPGYRHFTVKPYMDKTYSYVKGHFTTPYGAICAGWELSEDGSYVYRLTVPVGSSATVIMPGKEPVEAGSGTHEFR